MTTNIDSKLEELGFKLKLEFSKDECENRLIKEGWYSTTYERQEEGKPKICLQIRRHERYGTNITFTSFPAMNERIFATRSPVDTETASNLIDGYLEAIKKGEKFRP